VKKAISILLQTILLLIVFAIGSFLHPFNLRQVLAAAPGPARFFYWDGIVMMVMIYVVLLLIAVLRKRLAASAPLSTIALAIAAILGLLAKFGFVTPLAN